MVLEEAINEWGTMCEYVEQGYHVATTPDLFLNYPVGRHHYALLIVDDDGKIIVS
jgi:hypothetical protein